jgi:GNAT superfamily N-acetyltransferase
MSSEYRIALAGPHHFEQIQQVELAAAALFPEDDVPAHIRSKATSLHDLASAQANGMLWVALSSDEKPVGFAIVRLVDGSAHVQEIDVHPDHGRRGIGTSLIHSVCGWARSHGVAAVTLTTFRHLPWNAPFYQQLGFQPLGPDELTPALAAILRDEVARGLDPARRVAMLKQLRCPRCGSDIRDLSMDPAPGTEACTGCGGAGGIGNAQDTGDPGIP